MRKDRILSARRAVTLPWTESLREGLYELTSGQSIKDREYTKSVWANACMRIRGMELANLPWQIIRNEKPVEKHILVDMLRDFGRESFWEDAIRATEIDKLRTGAAYWLRDVDQLRRLNPSTMEVIKTNDGIAKFKQVIKTGDKTITNYYTRDEIVYFRGYHPQDDLGPGIPVIDLVSMAINTEYEAELMIQAHFKNDAIPGILLTTEQSVPEKEANRIIDWWNKRFRGSRKRGSVGVADKGLKAERIASNMVESELIAVREMARTDICAGFRVSKMLVSSFIDSTYANAAESRKSLIENLIIPEAQLYANAINQDLVPQVDPGVRFEFVPEELPILQEDLSDKEMRLASMYDKGIISEEYYRQEMGIEEKYAPTDPTIKVEQQYEKKAMKAFRRGESPDVPFESDILSVDRRILISARLKNAKTEQDIKRAFND